MRLPAAMMLARPFLPHQLLLISFSLCHCVLLVHRVQSLYGSCLGRFACRDKARYGAGDNDEQRGLHANAETHGGIDEHFLLKCAHVHGGVADGCIHPKVRTYAEHHADIAEEEGDNDALGDDEL